MKKQQSGSLVNLKEAKGKTLTSKKEKKKAKLDALRKFDEQEQKRLKEKR